MTYWRRGDRIRWGRDAILGETAAPYLIEKAYFLVYHLLFDGGSLMPRPFDAYREGYPLTRDLLFPLYHA